MKIQIFVVSLVLALGFSFSAHANTPLAQTVIDIAAAIKGDTSDEGQENCADTTEAGGAGQNAGGGMNQNDEETCRLGESPDTGLTIVLPGPNDPPASRN